MRVALLAHGSRGDIQPMLAVADALQGRGHRVRMTVNVNSAEWARRAGVEVIPMPPDVERFLRSAAGRAMLANGRIAKFFRELADLERRSDGELVSACREAARDADLVLSTIMTVFRGTSIAEAAGVPNLSLSTMPLYTTGQFASYLSPREGLGLPLLNRLSWRAYMALYWRGQRDMFNGTRAAVGLHPWRKRPLVELAPIVHMYSAHVRALPQDLPPEVLQSAFVTVSPELRARLGEASPPEGLDAWIDAGSPPVFFGFGSMPVLDPGAFLAMVVRLCDTLDIRALIGAGWSDFVEDVPSERVLIAPAFDHDRYLPRCRAAVHHGGAGTTHASLRAGLPTLICSIFADQPMWGHRVRALGVGDTLAFQKLTEGRLRAALSRVLDRGVAERAAQLGERLRGEDGTTLTVDMIERFAREQGLTTSEPQAASA